MKKMIAYCGIDCEKCDAYIATINDDQALREKTAKKWAELNNAPILPEHINCEGCRTEGVKTVFVRTLYEITGWENACRYRLCGQYISEGDSQILLFDLSEPETIRIVERGIVLPEEEKDPERDEVPETSETETEDVIRVYGIESSFPKDWDDTFGLRPGERSKALFERIRYQGDWEILRPAKVYMTAGDVDENVLITVKSEAHKMLEEMRGAV